MALSLPRDVDSSAGKLDREGRRERAELLVGAGSVTPHDHREARRPVEDGQRVMPGVRPVRDALPRAGEEGHDPRRIGTTVGGRASETDRLGHAVGRLVWSPSSKYARPNSSGAASTSP